MTHHPSSTSNIHDLYRRVPSALHDETSCKLLIEELTIAGKSMMEDIKARRSVTSPLLADSILQAFSQIANAYHSTSNCSIPQEQLLALSVVVTRLTRNILAGVDENKQSVIPAEPEIRRLCIQVTTFYRIKDDSFLPLQRALYQLLSNLVGVADHSTTERPAGGLLKVWTTTNRGEEDLIPRALESNDLVWNMACMILVLNAIRGTVDGARRIATHGGQIMLKIADKMTIWHDMESVDADRLFSIGCDIFDEIFKVSAENELYYRLNPTTNGGKETTPAQIILLKLLDGRIVTSTRSSSSSSSSSLDFDSPAPSTFIQTTKFLSDLLIDLSERIRTAVLELQSAVTPLSTRQSEAESGINTNDDTFGLAKNLQAGMLVSQGLTNLCLWETEVLEGVGVGKTDKVLMKEVIDAGRERVDDSSPMESRQGVVESATALLYSLDTLLPRLKPYRQPANVAAATAVTTTVTTAAPPATPTTAPPAAPTPPTPTPPPTNPNLLPSSTLKKLEPFAHFKRDLIRLIGTLSHRNKQVQDRVRLNGGVEMILSLCVVDDRSPYIREHALFAVRNLMSGNTENQAVIDEMAPIGIVGEDGLLKEMPERMGLKR